jgi:hypothetical protein
MSANADQQKRKLPRRLIIGLGAATVLVVVLAGIAPMLRGDGTARFVGPERTVAKRAIDFEQRHSSTSPLPSFMRQLHVEDVRPIRPDEKVKYCQDPAYISDDPTDGRYYVVILKSQYLFELGSRMYSEYGCDFVRFEG